MKYLFNSILIIFTIGLFIFSFIKSIIRDENNNIESKPKIKYEASQRDNHEYIYKNIKDTKIQKNSIDIDDIYGKIKVYKNPYNKEDYLFINRNKIHSQSRSKEIDGVVWEEHMIETENGADFIWIKA